MLHRHHTLTDIECGLFQNPPFTNNGTAITPQSPPPKWTAVVSNGSSTTKTINYINNNENVIKKINK